MLGNQRTVRTAREMQRPVAERIRRRDGGTTTAASALAFAATFALVLVYALRGGSYDLVAFEEYGLVIWCLLAVAIAVGVLPRRRPAAPLLLLCGALLAYAGWTAVSLIWTQSGELTTEEIARSLDYLGLVLLLSTALGRDSWRAAGAGLAFGALAVCLIAAASRLAPSAFPTNVVGIVFKTDRLSYPFGYWNAVAAWGAMATTIGLAWSAHDTMRVRRALALALVPAAVLVTYLSYSRAGVLGTALGVVLVFALGRNRLTLLVHGVLAAAGSAAAILAARAAPQIAHGTGGHGSLTVAAVLACAMVLCFSAAWMTAVYGVDGRRLPRQHARAVFAAGTVVVLIAAAVAGPRLARNAWHSFSRPVAASTDDPAARLLSLSGTRYAVWKSAFKAFSAHPLDGTGAGTFEFWWNSHSGGVPGFFRNAHNLWLENMAELGLPGLLLILAVGSTGVAVGVAVRRKVSRPTSVGVSTAFLAGFIVFLFHASVDWMWESTAVTVLALAGIAVLGARLAARAPQLRWWMRAGAVVLALGAGVVQLPGLVSTTDIRSSQAAERARNGNLALTLANDAVDAEPWSASAHEQRGLVLEAAGRYGEAAAVLRQAASEEPTNYLHWLDLARAETELGNIGGALADYSRAHQLRPASVAFQAAPRSGIR
ncbi:MAG TPA: O-antigen ligase family protein [Solirubrobacteraceae bacterium]|nr:O-antigen ligase family protein [Solirubrobacteraceae bacterium]